jgi:hypothetical protein
MIYINLTQISFPHNPSIHPTFVHSITGLGTPEARQKSVKSRRSPSTKDNSVRFRFVDVILGATISVQIKNIHHQFISSIIKVHCVHCILFYISLAFALPCGISSHLSIKVKRKREREESNYLLFAQSTNHNNQQPTLFSTAFPNIIPTLQLQTSSSSSSSPQNDSILYFHWKRVILLLL